MRRKILLATLALSLCAASAQSQTRGTAGARAGAETSASAAGRASQLDLASGTRLTAELQGTLDAERARVGDKVVLKTTEVVRAGGGTVLKKGTRLLGHVADVQKRTRGAAGSSLTLVFDRLESGSLSAPVVLTIDSITRAGARGRAGDDSEFGAGASARGRTSTDVRAGGTQGGSSSGGGLLGGVTGAVGNTVGGVAGAAGDVAGTTTETVGGVARGAGSALGEVRVTEAVGLSAEGGSTLSLAAGNLRLEKGTTFRLSVSESAGVGNN